MKKDQLTISVPSISVQEKLISFKQFLFSLVNNLKQKLFPSKTNQFSTSFNKSDFGNKKGFKSYLPIIIFGLFVVIVVGLIFSAIIYISKSSATKSNTVSVASAKATQNLNKEFSFPLKDTSGKEVSKIKFVIQNAELRDELIIQGQRAISVQGRTFLVLNLKITNDQNQDVKINTRDYIRLNVNGGPDWLAPEVHNDPVDVQPISTKYTRVAFAINNSDKNLKLKVGEIDGTKQEIKLTIQ